MLISDIMNSKIFTPTSNYLLDFLDSHISHKLEGFEKTKLSIESKKIITFLFNQIKIANQNPILSDPRSTNIQFGNDYDLIDENVKTHIETSNFIGKTCEFHIKSHHIRVNIFSETDIPDTYFKKIYIWLYTALEFSERKCSQKLSFYLYLTDLEKTVPTKNHSIDRINVNTGFTFPCRSKNEINIYRKEEWFKVLIHETLHNLGLDFSHHEYSRIDNKIIELFPVQSEVRLCETYCEMWAEIINIMLIVFTTTRNPENIDFLLKHTEKMLDYERVFSLFQCAKILKHFGISYTQLYERTDNAHMIRKMRYKENTPVLSYYIIKSFLMYNVNDFLEWCVSNNGISIRFHDADINRNLDNYFILIKQHYQDKKFIDCIDQLCDWFIKQEKTRRSKDTEFKTLRMSLFET